MKRIYTGETCDCKKGIERDNCPRCEGTGKVLDFRAMRQTRSPLPKVESTEDFKLRLRRMLNPAYEGMSIIGAPAPHPCVVRPKQRRKVQRDNERKTHA